MLKELMAAEAMRIRITNGKVPPPVQVCALAQKHSGGGFVGCQHDRTTTDGRPPLCRLRPVNRSCPPHCNCLKEVERQGRLVNPWTDMEKCIFLDQFLLFPKDFGRIARALANKSVRDCVAFYYDSKATIDYKAVLREHVSRRRGGRAAWSATVAAAKCVGATVVFGEEGEQPRLVLPSQVC
ncbi:hypothetical protein JKP88DRAFT_303528, partial [Tribonema minus]